MKWSSLWKVLRIVSEHAPEIIAVVQQLKAKDAPPPPTK